MAKNILSNNILEVLANAIRHETKINIIFQKEDNILISVDDRIAFYKWRGKPLKQKFSKETNYKISTQNSVFLCFTNDQFENIVIKRMYSKKTHHSWE